MRVGELTIPKGEEKDRLEEGLRVISALKGVKKAFYLDRQVPTEVAGVGGREGHREGDSPRGDRECPTWREDAEARQGLRDILRRKGEGGGQVRPAASAVQRGR